MKTTSLVTAGIAFLIALYEFSWIGNSSLAIVILGLAVLVGIQGAILSSIAPSKQA